MDRKVPPESDAAQALAMPWMTLVNERTGSDMRLIRKLDSMHCKQAALQVLTGVDGETIDYMATALLERRFRLYAKYLDEAAMQSMRAKFAAYRTQWMDLAAETSAQMARDPSPYSPEAQPLFLRWIEVSRAVWGPDPAVQEQVRLAHVNEPDILVGAGVSKEMIAYLGKAFRI